MKKTLLASAIAAATFSGSVFAQSEMSAAELAAKMDSMPSVYGNIQYAIAHESIDGGSSELSHFDNGTTIGVKHDHMIAPGVTGFLKLELDGFGADEKDSAGSNIDEAYIGVKGESFGQVWVGSDDSLYERTIDQIANFYEIGASAGGSYTTGEGDLVQYASPSFGGLTLGAAVQINGDGESQGADKSYPYQLAAVYAVDSLELAVAMDSNDGAASSENTYGVRAAYSLDTLSVSAEYQTRKDVNDVFGVQAVYAMGANQFAVSYEMVSDDTAAEDDYDIITLQALHNVSDHMYVYVEGYLQSNDNASIDEFFASGNSSVAGDERTIGSVGAVYYF